jgi:hypothetical protein
MGGSFLVSARDTLIGIPRRGDYTGDEVAWGGKPEIRHCPDRSGIAVRFDRDPSRSHAGLADDPIAALADATGAATPYAGLLHDVRCAIVVHGKSFAESHLNILCFARFLKVVRTLSTAH